MEEPKKVATVADVRAVAESLSWTEPEPVQVPKSGLIFILRKPTKYYWSLRRTDWTPEFCEKVDAIAHGQSLEQFDRSDMIRWLKERDRMATLAFVEPKASAHPDSDSMNPRWLSEPDQKFILDYLGGTVLADGKSVATFSGSQSGDAESSGHAGENLPQVAIGNAANVAG